MLHEKLFTNVSKLHKGLSLSSVCSLCGACKDNATHAIRDCSFAHKCWLSLSVLDRDVLFFTYDFAD